jgi:uncharacterized membrane protein
VRTVGEWLARRTPSPPELLRSRIDAALGAGLDDDVVNTERVCLDAAQRVLTHLLGEGRGDRHEAADLLAADALLTYALEFAADDPQRFDEQATRAMRRFGHLHQARV